MDIISVFGILIGILGIVVGNFLENGQLSSLIQVAAGCIVFGGTLGAVLLSSTRNDLKIAWQLFVMSFRGDDGEIKERMIKQIIEAAQLSRKEGIVALEPRLNGLEHPYMRRVFQFVVDGVDPNTVKDIFETQIHIEEKRLLSGARVFTEAGGYAPTIGIIGAVLGLIHIMGNLSDTTKLGTGIAVAFVATIYGVGSANLLFLPIASKAKRRINEWVILHHMILAGALGIVHGLNPYVLEQKLRTYLDETDVQA